MNGLLSGGELTDASQARGQARLRLVAEPPPTPGQSSGDPGRSDAGHARSGRRGHGYVLVAGVEGAARARMLCELREVLPADTRFVETDQTWRALALAEDSQMVVLVGDLPELSGAATVRLLARRQPSLPVLAVRGEATSVHAEAALG